MERRLGKRKFATGKYSYAFSDRSGMPFPYREMVIEPGTGLFVHRSESDGKWNRSEIYKDPLIPADAQDLENARPGVLSSEDYF